MSLGGVGVVIDTEGRPARQLVDFVFGAVVADPTACEVGSFALASRDGEVHLARDGRPMYTGPVDGTAATLLLDLVVERIAAACDQGLVLHAAALAAGGRGVLLPGGSGSGKTTLAGWLAAGDFDCLTDELVLLATGECVVSGLPRPLRIRGDSLPVLERRVGKARSELGCMASRDTHLLPLRALRPANRTEPVEVAVVVFARYDRRGDGRFVELSQAQAGLRLMECVVNARNLDGHGLGEAARLARAVPTFAVTWRRCSQVEKGLRQVLAAAAAHT